MKVLGIIGNPVEHSLSPKIHNPLIKKYNLPFIFIKFPTKSLENRIKSLKANPNFKGASITAPFKVEILRFLDEIDSYTEKIGACNTILWDGKVLKGYNTDCYGAIKSLKKHLKNLKGKKYLILGAGGVSRAIIVGLLKEGVKDILVLNRTFEKAKKLGKEFGIFYDNLENFKNYDYDVLINCTSCGMNEEKSPVKKQDLKEGKFVFDVIYSPSKTLLLKFAEEKKCKILNGFEMLAFQAEKQFELFTGVKLKQGEMLKVLNQVLSFYK